MRFLIPQFDTGILYEAGPIFLMLFFLIMVTRVLGGKQKAHYEEMAAAPLRDESYSGEERR